MKRLRDQIHHHRARLRYFSGRLKQGLAVFVLSVALVPVATIADGRELVTADPILIRALAANMAVESEDSDIFEAQVWLTVSDERLKRYIKFPDERRAILSLVYREAKRHNIDPDLVLALIQVESAFDRFAVSRVGAQGLMQVMPFWRLEIGRPHDNLTHVETNIRYGTVILAHYLERAKGDLVDALARYNGSRGKTWYPDRVVSAWRRRWRNKSRSELPELQASCTNYGLKACRYL